MIAIQFSFPAGRFHATPWGRHVNEGVPEWPPSPWRLLRALVSVWKRTCPIYPEERVRPLLQLLAEPPQFALPAAVVSHTRHYMPWEKKGPTDRTLVFDTFVSVSRHSELVAFWPETELNAEECMVLDSLLANLSFLGRAESWCVGRRLSEAEARAAQPRINCAQLNGQATRPDQEPVRVLCPDPQTAFDSDHTPKHSRLVGRGRDKQVVSSPIYDPDWHICLETLDVHAQRLSGLPGSRWVTYLRSADCLRAQRTRPNVHSTPLTKQSLTVVRYALDGLVLPLVEETLPLAEQARRHLMGRYKRVCQERKYGRNIPPDAEQFVSQVFAGKDAEGRPLSGHQHAYYLPSDEDSDGRIDHLTVYAEKGFDADEVAALDRLRRLPWGDGEPLRLLLVGLGNVADFRAAPLVESAVWVSATPFVASRYPKWRGRKRDDAALRGQEPMEFARLVLREEIERLRQRRPLAHIVRIERLEGDRVGAHKLRRIQFKRSRRKHGDDGGRHAWGAFRIVFDEPVRGPLCLGHSCHFGLGLFLPEQSTAGQEKGAQPASRVDS